MNGITRISAAIVLVALSMVVGVTSVRAAPEKSQLGTTTLSPLLSNILNIVNNVGDDSFSTANLSTMTTDPSVSTQHYGPYASGSTDSGTCGNDWANDSFNRDFTVFMHKDGSMVIVEQFKDGNFSTPASDSPTPNPSPGSCQSSSPGFIANGVTGKLHGYFIVPLPSTEAQTSNDPSCVAGQPTTPCTTTGFIDSHFTPCYFGGSGTCQVTTFFDHYTAPITSTGPNSGLIKNEWKNASTDRGGNSGDIRSCNAPGIC